MVVNRSDILEKLKLFQGGTGGLDSWLGETTPEPAFEALSDLENQPLTRSRLNQLLTLAHEAPVSQPLFAYYWLRDPAHTYDAYPATTNVGLARRTFSLSTNFTGAYTGSTWTLCFTSGASEPLIKGSDRYLKANSIPSSQFTGLMD